jgi:peptidoglycan hydrolase-like protein with peptidoglycan-binding domain
MDTMERTRRPAPVHQHPDDRRREARTGLAVVGAVLAGLVVIGVAGRGGSDPGTSSAAALPVVTAPSVGAAAAPAAAAPSSVPTSEALPDLESGAAIDADACDIGSLGLRLNDTGDGVTCLQSALAATGLYDGEISGTFDEATYAAVRRLQEERNLFVDGVVGRETSLELGIWPDEESLVVRTPPPAPGATDSMGFPLSSVASTGADAPPLPEGSGEGRRLVYQRAGQRVWAVGDDGEIIRSWLVSGSQYMNELPGTHYVYSRSEMSTAWNGKAYLPKMVRWLQTQRGHIGFHAIPLHVEDNSPYQTEAELGTRLSGGCQRQANRDADFVWAFADIGTKVVVI